MFKTFSTTIFLSLLTFSAAHAQSEQPIQAKVPFTFTVKNTTLPAGNYRLTYSPTSSILLIRGLDESAAGAYVSAVPSGSGDGPGRLMFNCYGESCYLAQVWQGIGSGRGLQVPRGERERGLSFLTRVVSISMPAK